MHFGAQIDWAFERGRHVRKHLQANRDARFVYDEGGLMNVRADLTRRSYAEPCECPWHLLQHPGEVLPTERLLGGRHRVRSEHLFSGLGEPAYAARVVDRGRYPVGDRNVYFHPERQDNLCGQLRDELLGQPPSVGIECAQRPNDLPVPGMAFATEPA